MSAGLKYIDEFRDPERIECLLDRIKKRITGDWTIMEVCGGQTHAIIRHGLDRILPDGINIVHGPGCPVCIVPPHVIDNAVTIAEDKKVILCTFGDMLRVPGTNTDFLKARASGCDIRAVYSPLDALQVALDETDREVVFLAIGFETTAPANALAVARAQSMRVKNFTLLTAQALIPPLVETILRDPGNVIQGLLAPGHVCTVDGYQEYEMLTARYNIPIVVTGFEPYDLMDGIYHLVTLLEKGENVVVNSYARAVKREGNLSAKKIVKEYFEIGEGSWRGLGRIPRSGLHLREKYGHFNAEKKFQVNTGPVEETSGCRSAEVLRGKIKPEDCPLFGAECTPENPFGAPMVSSEGVCAAYYKYRRLNHGKADIDG